MTRLSDEKRWQVISAWKQGQGIRGVARSVGVSPTTVQRWVDRYKSTSSVKAVKPRGRKRILDGPVAAEAMELLLGEEHGHSDSIAQHLVIKGTTPHKVSKTTLIRAVRRAGVAQGKPLKVVRGRPRKQLTVATRQKRLDFAMANKTRSWATTMFSDRKKFQFYYPGSRVYPVRWVRKGEVATAAAVNHAQTVNIYAGITKYGVTACHLVAGTSKHKTEFKNKKGAAAKNITAAEYQHVLKSTLLPEGTRIFTAQGLSNWTFQQDNDPTHRSAKATIQAWNAEHYSSLSLLGNWPPNSPDLNPIENVWAWVDAKVNALGCKTFDEYRQAVLEHFKKLPKTFITNLYKSLPKRMAKVIELGGNKTKY